MQLSEYPLFLPMQYPVDVEISQKVKEKMGNVEVGEFGADMKVSLINDGPFTIVWDSGDW